MKIWIVALLCLGCASFGSAAESWPQLQGDALRSGNAAHRQLPARLGLVGAVPLTDGIYASPAIADGVVYVVDGSGVVHAIDADTLEVEWKFATRGGAGNCNNVSSPAVMGQYLHVGTMAGFYYVLDRASGRVVREIDCGEAIFSSPVAGKDRVYFATIGAQVYAVEPAGEVAWTWDFVKEVIGFEGNRWKGE
ncbi:MAG: outer membrane protein assembly factor BamB family protein, partial [Aureliella sp.]